MRTQPVTVCVVCGGPGDILYEGLVDDLFATPGRWRMRSCVTPGCGTLWLDPMPLPEDIGQAYAHYYTHREEAGSDGLTVGLLRRVNRRVEPVSAALLGVAGERRRLEHMFLDGARPGRLLDVGCGDGGRLAMFRDLGWEVEGTEADEAAAAVARRLHGVTVHVGPLAAALLEPASFDAVVANHVVEHVHDPLSLLREMVGVLKPGGTAVVVTPNSASAGHRRFGRHWRGLEPPRHLWVFSPASLRSLAERAGFAEVDVATSSAHAQSIARLSRPGSAGPTRLAALPARIRHEAGTMAFQVSARRLQRRDPLSGEECVLQAVR